MRVWKGIELQGAQIPLRDGSSQPSFESGRNYRELKPGGWTTGLEEDKITWYSNHLSVLVSGHPGLEEDKITWYSNANRKAAWTFAGLEEDKITWYSNSCCYRSTRFGEEKATWYSNQEGGLPG